MNGEPAGQPGKFWQHCKSALGLDEMARRLRAVAQSQNRLLPRLVDYFQRLQHSRGGAQGVDKGTQLLLALKYRELAERGVFFDFADVEFRNYSQSGEDGILHYIFALIGTTDKRSVEMCAGQGDECNTANLILNHG